MEPNNEVISIPEILPVLPLRDVVVFPYLIIPLSVGRPHSMDAVQRAMAGDRLLLVVSQKDGNIDEPVAADLYLMGVVVLIMRMVKQPDGQLRVLVQGLTRARMEEIVSEQPVITARVAPVAEKDELTPNVTQEALMRAVRGQIKTMAELGKTLNPDFLMAVESTLQPGRLADLVTSNLEMKIADAQTVLELIDPSDRLQHLVTVLTGETELLRVQARITESARDHINQSQHEYFLREQMKAIQSELGVTDERAQEIEQLKEQIEAAQMPPAVKETADKELERFEHMHGDSAEAQIVRTYLDWLISVPWAKSTQDRLDVLRARRILDADHFGLDEVKDRICEFLAVRKLKPKGKGPILCFVGPPGVGKTSLGRSIARAMGRNFIRLSLGGLRDEAEIRGHRRTYIGAMPGRIIQSIKQTGSNNPVFMLDEIDKLGADFRGDPASALLEVLDPEQNDSFSDHYLNVPFDLSRVMFITTANLSDPIPGPLRDRMEIIEIPGYTQHEKLKIAYRYLLPRQIEQNGLKTRQIGVSQKAMEEMAAGYTREAGLRNLERTIGKVCRKVARQIAERKLKQVRITIGNLPGYLGPQLFTGDEDELGGSRVGVATGLAWTPAGGEILHIEAAFVDGRGGLTLTGHLGEVMKESAQAALTYARSRAARFGVDKDFFSTHDLHIHVPAGAIPKDGPSAGITMATAVTSAMLARATAPDLAMTGEITVRGTVLPVGGIKEKVLAAQRAGKSTILLPMGNKKDVVSIPPAIRRKLTLHFVKSMDDVLELALTKE